jgi:trans-aconitate methyltransferase
MGRWSRLLADRFLAWLAAPRDSTWLEVGCGTGALTSRILAQTQPHAVLACDRSPTFVTYAQAAVPDPRVTFLQAEAPRIPQPTPGYDVVVSGLVLNFLPDPLAAAQAMVQAATTHATVAAYVWDYADGMAFLRHFWDAALQVDPAARLADEGQRFPLCQPDALASLWVQADLDRVRTAALEVETTFQSFEDYWTPFEGGQGPAPTYLLSLPRKGQRALQEFLRSRLPFTPEGTLPLRARAWAVAGERAG